jgi:hypothetical protein
MSFVFFSEVGYVKERNPLDTNEVVEIVSGFQQDQFVPNKTITAEPHTHTHTHTHTQCNEFCIEI